MSKLRIKLQEELYYSTEDLFEDNFKINSHLKFTIFSNYLPFYCQYKNILFMTVNILLKLKTVKLRNSRLVVNGG